MGQILLFIIAGVVIAVGLVLLVPKARQKAVGIYASVIGRDAKKEEKKDKILELLSQKKRDFQL